MRNRFILGLGLVLLVILQSTVLDYIKIFNTRPDIVLIAVIIIGLYLDLKWVMIFSYAAGILKDVLGVLPFGINTLVLPLLGFLIYKLSRRIEFETEYVRGAIIFLAAILENLFVFVLLIALGLDIPFGRFFRFTIIGSIYTTLLFLFLSKTIKVRGLASHF